MHTTPAQFEHLKGQTTELRQLTDVPSSYFPDGQMQFGGFILSPLHVRQVP